MGTINKRIKERRESLGLKLADVAKKLNVTDATVQRYESGTIKNIKHQTVSILSQILKCDPGYLMGWIDEPNPSKNAYLTPHENAVITAYRSKPEMQMSIDKLLDIENEKI